MASAGTWWTGEPIGEGAVALVAFPGAQEAVGQDGRPVLGAGSSASMNVLLLPHQFGAFLRKHEDGELACYDAAALHWLLENQFALARDDQSRKVLWGYSQESRMVDIMLLDQHVRRHRGEGGAQPSPMDRLIRRHTGVKLPPAAEIARRISEALSQEGQDQATVDAFLPTVVAVAAGVYRVYECLLEEARGMTKEIEEANCPRKPAQSPPDGADEMGVQVRRMIEMVRDRRRGAGEPGASPVDANEPALERPQLGGHCSFGPLGVGINVQGAIALRRPGSPRLQIDPDRTESLRIANERRYREASARLYNDRQARSCFEWVEGDEGEQLVGRGRDGLPIYDPQTLKRWLRSVGESLCDIHYLPAHLPLTNRGDPDFDPETWGIWAACHRSLRAWRDTERAVRAERLLAQAVVLPPVYDVVPVLHPQAPDLVAIRSLRIVPVFRARPGYTFVVGSLPLLRLHSFAAVLTEGATSRGRLAGYFLGAEDPIGMITAELHVQATNGAAPAEDRGEDATEDGARFPFEDAVARFHSLEETDPEYYWSIRWLAQALLETLPLGLPMVAPRGGLSGSGKFF